MKLTVGIDLGDEWSHCCFLGEEGEIVDECRVAAPAHKYRNPTCTEPPGTVQCVAPTVDYAVRRIRVEILPRYPAVDEVVAITHTYGCGVAIDAPGAAVPIRTLRNIGQHPNFGGAPLIVSLGFEKLQPARLFPEFPILENDPNLIRMQDQQGFGEMIAAIMRAAETRLEQLSKRRRRTCPASDLIVGVQCGGSDAFSGVTCNPAVGYAADVLVQAGATIMFSEVTEIRDAVHAPFD